MRRRSRPDVEAAEALALLRTAGATLATAESLTGGRLAAAVTSVPGASASYLGGFVTYATELKESLLGVPRELVEQYGVVSGECASAMAAGCRAATGATYGVATTGVAGPDQQEGKPVGTVFVGLSGPEGETVLTMELLGDRAGSRTGRVGRRCRPVWDSSSTAREPASRKCREDEAVGTHRREALEMWRRVSKLSWGTTPTRVAFPPQPPLSTASRPAPTTQEDPDGAVPPVAGRRPA